MEKVGFGGVDEEGRMSYLEGETGMRGGGKGRKYWRVHEGRGVQVEKGRRGGGERNEVLRGAYSSS